MVDDVISIKLKIYMPCDIMVNSLKKSKAGKRRVVCLGEDYNFK